MNLTFLETFVWVARLQSFTAAAERSRTSQQCASARVAALERELGVSLIRHELRHFKLTPEGIAAFERAETVLKTIEDMKTHLAGVRYTKTRYAHSAHDDDSRSEKRYRLKEKQFRGPRKAKRIVAEPDQV